MKKSQSLFVVLFIAHIPLSAQNKEGDFCVLVQLQVDGT